MSQEDTYRTITALSEGIYTEKRSKFIAIALPVRTLEEVKLEVNETEGGTILLNTTTPDLSKGSWSGKYYTDFPITVTASNSI